MDDHESLSHTRGDCKYHVVFNPKYRRKAYPHKKSAETIMGPCAGKTIHRKLLVIIFIVVWNRAGSEQAGKIVGVYGVAQEKRLGHMEDFLHGAQIRRVREKDLAGKRDAVHVGVSQW